MNHKYEGISESFRTESITKYTLKTIKHSLRSNAKDFGGKTHWTDSQNNNTTASSGRELYYLQFLLQAASPENLNTPSFISYNFRRIFMSYFIWCFEYCHRVVVVVVVLHRNDINNNFAFWTVH
jgi:hypothetical protein